MKFKKEKILIGSALTILLLMFPYTLLLLLGISDDFVFFHKTDDTRMRSLNYVIVNRREPITLDIYEAEAYEAAVVVQQLVGGLVYHSNFGRYEPRLAKNWRRLAPDVWEFHLHAELFCENGEAIDAIAFKKSLQRTIGYLSRNASVPVLNKLKGYREFVTADKDLEGIKAFGRIIQFHFTEPVRSGLVQILSFAPFGYICEQNLDGDGSWKDPRKFISSGPYRVSKVEIGREYVLETNPKWTLPRAESAPEKVIVTHEIPANFDNSAWVVDSARNAIDPPPNSKEFRLVPEYINTILLGNLEEGYFADLNNRRYLKNLVRKKKKGLSIDWGIHHPSDSFYPNQAINQRAHGTKIHRSIRPPERAFLIEGREPPLDGSPRSYAWRVLKSVLHEAGWEYRFANQAATTGSVTDMSYDIRLRGSSIGGGVEAWGLEVVFCSKLGIAFPDPTGSVCSLVKSYEKGEISYDELREKFLSVIENDAAILPVSHYGVRLYFSESIRTQSVRPPLNIIKFDQLETQ